MKKRVWVGAFSMLLISGAVFVPIMENNFNKIETISNEKISDESNPIVNIQDYVDNVSINGYSILLEYHVPIEYIDANGFKYQYLKELSFFVTKDSQTIDEVSPMFQFTSGTGFGDIDSSNNSFSNTIVFDKYYDTTENLNLLMNANSTYSIWVSAQYVGGDMQDQKAIYFTPTLIIGDVNLLGASKNASSSIGFNAFESSSKSATIQWNLDNVWLENGVTSVDLIKENDLYPIHGSTLSYVNDKEPGVENTIDVWSEIWSDNNNNVSNTINKIELKNSTNEGSIYNISGKIVIENIESNSMFSNVSLNFDVWSTSEHNNENNLNSSLISNVINFKLSNSLLSAPTIVNFYVSNIGEDTIQLNWIIYNFKNQISEIYIFEHRNKEEGFDSRYSNSGFVEVRFDSHESLISGSLTINNLNPSETHNYLMVVNYNDEVKSNGLLIDSTSATTLSSNIESSNNDKNNGTFIALIVVSILLFIAIIALGYLLYKDKSTK